MPSIVEFPKMNYADVRGKGEPNEENVNQTKIK